MALARLSKGAPLDVEDLYLLEAVQITYLPGWIPEREFAAVLWAYPSIKRFLLKKCPPVGSFIERILAEHGPVGDQKQLAECCEKVVWTIPDLLTYNRCPEVYDSLAFHQWDFAEVTEMTPLDGKTVVDTGAGTGRVALAAAATAKWVFAVEPVARLRQFIRDKAAAAGHRNVFVLDGLNQAIPLPDGFADVLITSHALGWHLHDELGEFERVVKRGGWIIHCPGTAERPQAPRQPAEDDTHATLVSPQWQYHVARYQAPDGWKRKYWKQVRSSDGVAEVS